LIRVTHGVCSNSFDVVGRSVAYVRENLETLYHIPEDALALIGGEAVSEKHVLRGGEELDFLVDIGSKGVGEQVWDEKEFCLFFKITLDDLHAWIAQGLSAKRCLDGSIRITATAADEYFRGRVIESPYMTADQAAEYLRTTVKGIYSLLERRKIKKLPGSRTILFTRDLLDAYVQGGEA